MEQELQNRAKQSGPKTPSPQNSTDSQELQPQSQRVQTVQRWQSTLGNRRTTQLIKSMRNQQLQRDADDSGAAASGQIVLPEPGIFQITPGQLQSIYDQDVPSNVVIQGAAPDNGQPNPESGNTVQADGDDTLSATRDPYTIQITANIPGASLPQWRTRFGQFGLLQQAGLQLSVNLDPTRGPLVPQSYAAYAAVTALSWHIQHNWLDLTVALGQAGFGLDTGTGVSGQVGGQVSLALPGLTGRPNDHTNLIFSGAVTVAPGANGAWGITPNPFTITFGGNF